MFCCLLRFVPCRFFRLVSLFPSRRLIPYTLSYAIPYTPTLYPIPYTLNPTLYPCATSWLLSVTPTPRPTPKLFWSCLWSQPSRLILLGGTIFLHWAYVTVLAIISCPRASLPATPDTRSRGGLSMAGYLGSLPRYHYLTDNTYQGLV